MLVERTADPYTRRLLADAPLQSPDSYAAMLAGHDRAAVVKVDARGVSKGFGVPARALP